MFGAVLQEEDSDQIPRRLGIGEAEDGLLLGGKRLRNAADNCLRNDLNGVQRSWVVPRVFFNTEFRQRGNGPPWAPK
jgi:hypothetical protein